MRVIQLLWAQRNTFFIWFQGENFFYIFIKLFLIDWKVWKLHSTQGTKVIVKLFAAPYKPEAKSFFRKESLGQWCC